VIKLSIIIPAYNEEEELPSCLESVQRVMATLCQEGEIEGWELIVTDNNSTDRTSEIARAAGARVVFEPVNQIARARNAGAADASGDWFLFIDADSRLHLDSMRDMLRAIQFGGCGAGGCLIRMDGAPWWGRFCVGLWNAISRTMRWAAGSFVFCRADAYRDVGGFDEQFFAAEELYFSEALKRWCRDRRLRFRILRRQPHASSARKFHLYSVSEILQHLWRTVSAFGRTVRDRTALDFFYDGRR